MMDFRLSDETLAYQQHCHRFAEEIIRPAAAEYDRDAAGAVGDHPRGARLGPARPGPHPEDGHRREGLRSVIYAEELHWGCAGIALAIQASSLAAAGIAASGTPEQIARWMPECFGLGDEIKLGAYAVTEAGAGSDVKSLRTTAGATATSGS